MALPPTPVQVILGRLCLLVEASFGAMFLAFIGVLLLLNTQGGFMGGGVATVGSVEWATAGILLVGPAALFVVSMFRHGWVPWVVVPLQLAVAIGVTYVEVSHQSAPNEANLMVGWMAAIVVVVAGVAGWLLLVAPARAFYTD